MGNFGLWIFAVMVFIGLTVTVNGQDGEHNGTETADTPDTGSTQDKPCDATLAKIFYERRREMKKNGNESEKAIELEHDLSIAYETRQDKEPCFVEGMTCNAAGKCVEQENDKSRSGSTADSARVIPAYGPFTFVVNALLASLFLLACSN